MDDYSLGQEGRWLRRRFSGDPRLAQRRGDGSRPLVVAQAAKTVEVGSQNHRMGKARDTAVADRTAVVGSKTVVDLGKIRVVAGSKALKGNTEASPLCRAFFFARYEDIGRYRTLTQRRTESTDLP